MSTKIYNGFRFCTPDGSRPDLFGLVERVAGALTPALADRYRSRVAELASSVLDGCPHPALDGTDASDVGPVYAAERALAAAAAEIRATRRRNPRMDFECDVQFIADRTDESALLMRVFCEQAVTDVLLSVPGVVEFAYFDNTDRPERCSEAEWADRRDVWFAAMDTAGSFPGAVMWSAPELGFVEIFGGDRARLVAAVPSVEERAKRLVRHRTVAAFHPGEGQSPSEALTQMTDLVRDALADDALVAAAVADLPEITADSLFSVTE